MVYVKKLKVGDRLIFFWDEFDGAGALPGVVSATEEDHAIVEADGQTLWLDKRNADMFSIDAGIQKCYTHLEGGEYSDMKTNAEIVEKYHSQLTNIRVRFPSEEQCGVDYAKLIRDRALELGFVNTKGRDKGTGSANAYILHLVEQDLINAGMINSMKKGMSEVVKKETD